ncbi:MAG: glycosyltransferase family 4 protein [Deltaproteobacteria bacterium]|nr:glycosyltransferase family 4 protein [Deltaproteobacteria bacterium]
MWQELRNQNRPFAVEVIADPYDTFSPGAIKHCLRPLLRWWAPLQLRRLCREANGALYVTSQALQRRYPCPAYSVGVSDVELSDGAFVSTPRPPPSTLEPFTLIQVGSLNQLYKGPDILIDAVSKCASAGLDIHLVIVGDGKHRLDLEARAAMQGLGNRVRFLGRLPAGKAVRFQLDQADLFVMPSRMEGLPRALLEAMARALPCIASRVGGIPELLAPEDLFPPNDVDALARKIYEVAIDPERQALMSARNLKKAKEYHIDILLPKRIAFYRHIKEMTSEWLQNQRDHR